MAVTVTEVAADLEDEHLALDAVVADLPDDAWSTPTASPGWSVADQIGHLGYFDRTAARAITDPDRFADDVDALIAAGRGAADLTLGEPRALAPTPLLAWWREGRSALLSAATGLTDDAREARALALDRAIRQTKKADWRGNKFKEREVRNAIQSVLGAEAGLVDTIFEIVKNQREY